VGSEKYLQVRNVKSKCHKNMQYKEYSRKLRVKRKLRVNS